MRMAAAGRTHVEEEEGETTTTTTDARGAPGDRPFSSTAEGVRAGDK